MGVEDNLPVAVDPALAGVEQLVDVGLLDRMAAELDFDIGEIAEQPRRTVARPHVLDRDSRHPLRKLGSLAPRELARAHVGDIAALDSAALALAGAEHDRA